MASRPDQYLGDALPVKPQKLATAIRTFRRWAEGHELVPSETTYFARTRDRRPLRFTPGGDSDAERLYATHWFSPELSARDRERLVERLTRPPDLVVISPVNDWTCTR
jgi:hypothetical protein